MVIQLNTPICGGARKGSRSTELEDAYIYRSNISGHTFVHEALVKQFLQLYTVGSLLCSLCSQVVGMVA